MKPYYTQLYNLDFRYILVLGNTAFFILLITNVHMLIKKCQAKSSISSIEININLQPLDNGNNQNNNNAINLNNNRYNKEIIGPIAFIIGTLSLIVVFIIFSPTFFVASSLISYTFQDLGPLDSCFFR
jgi:hypothetical protein